MADESIGGVTVSIRGDASQLNQDFAQAQQQAQQAGEKIATSFASSATGVNSLSEALAAAKIATKNLADAELQLGTFAKAGNEAATAAIQGYRTALASAQESVALLSTATQASVAVTVDSTAAMEAEAVAAYYAAAGVEALGKAHSHVVSEVAAASGTIRVFEGNLPIRAVERFAVTTLGLGPILQAAFPIIGAIAFGEMVYKVWSELDPLIAAEKELAEVTKRLDHEYAQLAKEIEHIQIEDLTVKFGKAAGMKIAAFYSATDLAEDQTRIKTLEADIARARAQMASDAATAQTKSNPLVSTLEAFNPLITGERFAANRDFLAQEKKIQEAEDEIGALRLKGQKATRQAELDGDREDKDRRDQALSAAREAAAAAKAIDDATERNELAANARELASAKEAISARLNLDKISTEAELALIDDKHTRTILAAANEVAAKVASEQQLNDLELSNLQKRLAMLDDNIAQTYSHGKAGAAERIRLLGEEEAANDKYYADKLKRADDVNAALASLGVLEVRENKARLDEELKDWTENANKELDVAQKAFEKNKQIDRRVFDSKARESADVERGGLNEQKILLERNYALALDHSAEAKARLGEATLSIDKQILQAQLDRLSKVVENDKATHQADDILARDQETLTRATIQGTLAIEQETTHVKLLEQAANRLHQVFAGLKADFEHAFQSLAHNLSSAIIGAKSFHDAWQHTIRGVAESLLNTLIGAAFGALEHELAKLIARIPLIAAIQKTADHAAAASSLARIATVKAAQAAADAAALAGGLATIAALSAAQATADTARAVSTSAVDVGAVFSLAAVAAAAAFASIAAIPIIGPALAPAAAALAYVEAAAYAPLASFDKGGFVPDDMIAQIHKGEYIVPAAAAQRGIYDPHHGQDGGNNDEIVQALNRNTAALKDIHGSVSTTAAVNATTTAVEGVKQSVDAGHSNAMTAGNILSKVDWVGLFRGVGQVDQSEQFQPFDMLRGGTDAQAIPVRIVGPKPGDAQNTPVPEDTGIGSLLSKAFGPSSFLGGIGDMFGGNVADSRAMPVRVVEDDSRGGKSLGGGLLGNIFGLLGGFAEGGWVSEDQIAKVHKGEYVLSAAQAKGLQATGTQLPSLPSVHGSTMPQLPNVSSSNSSSSIGEVKITVNGAQRPQETAREIAKYLKSLSPKFSPAS